MPLFGPMTMTRLYSIRNGFTAGARAKGAKDTEWTGASQSCRRGAQIANADAVGDEPDRTIAHGHIDSTGVLAAGGIKTVLGIVVVPCARWQIGRGVGGESTEPHAAVGPPDSRPRADVCRSAIPPPRGKIEL